MVKMYPAVTQAVVTFPSHLVACQFVQALTVEPFGIAVKHVVYVFEVSWYVTPPMPLFAGPLPVIPVALPQPSVLEQRVADMQLTLDTLAARVVSLEAELETWRRLCEDLVSTKECLDYAVAPVNAPLSPRSLYTQDEVECFLRECLP